MHLQGVDLVQWSGYTHHFQLPDFYATYEFQAGLLGRAAARLDWPGATPPLGLARRLTGYRRITADRSQTIQTMVGFTSGLAVSLEQTTRGFK